VSVVSNRMKVSDLVLGISDGPFKVIDSFPNLLGKGPFLGKTLGNRSWGTARVVESPWDDLTRNHGEAMPSFLEMAIEPKSSPATEQLDIIGYDAAGKALTNCSGGRVNVVVSWVKNIKRWEVRSRPFQYIVFKGVHFDSN
jgi:hypothetical protein